MTAKESLEDVIGAHATVEAMVTEDMTAHALGSGDVIVLATPTILALAERAAVQALAKTGRVPEGATTVGTSVKLVHLEPSPIGAIVRATASLDRVAGRRYHFIFNVWDAAGEIAGGAHVRVLVDKRKFEEAAVARLSVPGADSGPES
jgi:predicted thioesterase